jgi:Gpi18-like mannosyltransferase
MTVDGQVEQRMKRAGLIVLLAGLVVGGGVRFYWIQQPPNPAAMWDHEEYASWGLLMLREGFTSLYSQQPPDTKMYSWSADRVLLAKRPEAMNTDGGTTSVRQICNYPPLFSYFQYVQILLLRAYDEEMVCNTVAARGIFASFSMAAELLLVWAVWRVVRRLTSGRQNSVLLAGIAGATVYLAPPLIMDTVRWTQTDAWVLAGFLWCIDAMTRGQWRRAGVYFGIALGVKTLGILLAPVWGMALLAGRPRTRVLAGLVLAGVVFLVPAIPFALESGSAWFEEVYQRSLSETFSYTTLRAFNAWYFDLLLTENDDATVLWFGLTKGVWGKVFLGIGGLILGVVALWRLRGARSIWLRCAAVFLSAAVLLPAGVHERYIVLPAVVLMVAAVIRPVLFWGVAPFVFVATFQVAAPFWMSNEPEARTWGRQVRAIDWAGQYEALREHLPGEEFEKLRRPDEQRAWARGQYLEAVAGSSIRVKEWGLTVLEVFSGVVCCVMLLVVREGRCGAGNVDSRPDVRRRGPFGTLR